MTTNVPQDVLKLAEQAGLLPEPLKLYDEEYLGQLVKFAELLRAQRQQVAEPVAWMHHFIYEDGEPEAVLSHSKEIPAILGGEYTGKTEALYTTPPQANALVAAAYRDAAELEETCQLCGGSGDVEHLSNGAPDCYLEVGPCHKCNGTGAIPADAEAALREVSEKLAEAIKGAFKDEIASAKHFNLPGVADALEAFQDTVVTFAVNSVLGEGGK
jgi:hypothetical protein